MLALCFLIFSIIQLSASLGFGNSAPTLNDTVNPAVALHAPIPGDIWYVGQIKDIIWTATDTNLRADSIYIFYSLDIGATFNPLAGPLANTGIHTLQMPAPVSDLAKIRIIAIDSFGNVSYATNPLVLTYNAPPPLQVQNVTINMSGNDALISWQAVTENAMNQPIIPDGYLLFESDKASQNPEDFTFLTNTSNTEYLYLNAPARFSQRFFYVVAYKDYSGRLRKLLPQSSDIKQLPLTLQDIRNRIGESGEGCGK